MPFNKTLLGRATNEGNNSILECLSHKVCEQADDMFDAQNRFKPQYNGAPQTAALIQLRANFNAYYGVNLSIIDLIVLLRSTQNRAYRAQLLAPVLRMQLPAPHNQPGTTIQPTAIRALANAYNISVEAYAKPNENVDVIIPAGVGAVNPNVVNALHHPLTLKLWNEDGAGTHWEYEGNDIVSNNAHNLLISPYAPYGMSRIDALFVRQRVRNALNSGNRDLNTVLAGCEARIPQAGGNWMQNLMQGMSSLFGQNMGQFSGPGILGKIGGILSSFQQLMYLFMIIPQKLGKFINPGSPLDADDFAKHPEAAPKFAHFVAKIEESGNPGAKSLAKSLNIAWGNNPDSAQVWLQLEKALTSHNLFDEAREVLKEHEDSVVNTLNQNNPNEANFKRRLETLETMRLRFARNNDVQKIDLNVRRDMLTSYYNYKQGITDGNAFAQRFQTLFQQEGREIAAVQPAAQPAPAAAPHI